MACPTEATKSETDTYDCHTPEQPETGFCAREGGAGALECHEKKQRRTSEVIPVHVDCMSAGVLKPCFCEFDNDFKVNGFHKVNTPRSSPTLLILRKLFEDFKPMVTKYSPLKDLNDHVRGLSDFILRSMKRVRRAPVRTLWRNS